MQTVEFYDRWVNGAGLDLVELASGKAPPKEAPAPSGSCASGAPTASISLERYDGREPELPRLDAGALRPVSHVLVHGSMATGDACPFSDIDVAVILEDRQAFSAGEHRAAVYELRRLLHAALAYDPLMHHGLMFLPASALWRYDERFLPIDTLRYARVLHGSPSLDIAAAPAPEGAFAQSLGRCAVSLRKHLRDRKFLQNDYRLKNFLSGALLMPARVLAARGTHVYKRESFDMARDLFDRSEWEFIARCEGLRAFWKFPPEPLPHRLVPNRSHPRLRQIIGSSMSPAMNAQRLSKAMIAGLLRSGERFLDRVEAFA